MRWYIRQEDPVDRAFWLKCPHCGNTTKLSSFFLEDIPDIGEKPVFPCMRCAKQNHLPGPRDQAKDLHKDEAWRTL